MKAKNSIIVACLVMSAAVAGAVDWNNPQLASADMSAIKVTAPKPVVVIPKGGVAVKVTLHVLKMRAKFFLGKSVTTEAVLANNCGRAAKPCFTLQVGHGSREVGLPVIAFLPPRAMLKLVGKRLELTGAIETRTEIVKGKRSVSFQFRVNKYKIVIKK